MRPLLLFVGEDSLAVDGRGSAAHRLSESWTQRYVRDRHEALDLIEQRVPEAVVAAEELPGGSGRDLLQEIRERHPTTIRVLMAAHAGATDRVLALNAAQLTLVRPCAEEALQGLMVRVNRLRESIWSTQVFSVLGGGDLLPAFPATCARIELALRDPEVSISEIAELLAQDAGLAAGVLRLVNSPYFGLRWPIKRLRDGVIYIGLNGIEAMVMSAAVLGLAAGGHSGVLERLQAHSLFVARLARELASEDAAGEGDSDLAYVSGLLHDAGALVLCGRMPRVFARFLLDCRATGRSLSSVEEESLGVTHAQIGACLLDHWGLPHEIVEAVAFHHDLQRVSELGAEAPLLRLVHSADRCAHGSGVTVAHAVEGECVTNEAEPAGKEESGHDEHWIGRGDQAVASLVAAGRRHAATMMPV
jgi:putative nucleotidyltransferase with HDIG domain